MHVDTHADMDIDADGDMDIDIRVGVKVGFLGGPVTTTPVAPVIDYL